MESLVVDDKDELRKLFSRENRVVEGSPTFKVTLPTKSNYYIARTLITRSVIDAKLFSSFGKEVFVAHGGGIDHVRLGELEETDTSTNQVRRHQLSVRFIFLENFRDWPLLRQNTTNPIHLMRHREGKFHWISTKGDISTLQKTSHEEEHQDKLSEEEFIREIETGLQFPINQPIFISDSPGMGKSLLLENIGRQLQQRYSKRIIAFIVISEFVIQIKELLRRFDKPKKAMVEALLQILCENNSAREQFIQKITTRTENPSTEVELMFDGFDEVSTENFDLDHECLEILKTDFSSAIRVWVTTRPEHLQDFEKRFSVLGYNIQAFQEKHRIDFLVSFWNSQRKNLHRDKLQNFSKNCLHILNKKLNKKDEDIAGIPLQCMMIAEVYSDEAHRLSRLDYIPAPAVAGPCIDINSISDLYKETIKHKIEKFIGTYQATEEQINSILPCHMYLALQLIFPSHAHQFNATLKIPYEFKLDHLVNVGILERRGSATKDPARFIHRTFAEYLVARFFFSYVMAHSTIDLQNPSQRLPNSLFEFVLECSVTKWPSYEVRTSYTCSFKHPVLCHFLMRFWVLNLIFLLKIVLV